MAIPNSNAPRAPNRYDDAENIRKFTAQIRRPSGQQAFPSGPNATSGVASASGNENRIDDEHRHHAVEESDRLVLQPRALQQILDESPQLQGIRAPHPTPESHRPSPSVGAEEPPEFSNEEIGLAMMQAFDSLPSSGGLEASKWAKKGPMRKGPVRFANIETKRSPPIAKQEENSNAEEARKRSQEHNENFERMSFKIADAPSQGKTFPSKPYVKPDSDGYVTDKQDEKPRAAQPSYKEALGEGFSSGIIKSLTSPSDGLLKNTFSTGNMRSPTHASNLAKEDRRCSVGTQTETEEYVLIDKDHEHGEARKGWVKVNWPLVMLPTNSAIETAVNQRFERAKEAHQKALALLRSTTSKEDMVETLVDMGILHEKPVTADGVSFVAYLPITTEPAAEQELPADTSVVPAKEMPKENVSTRASVATEKDAVTETKPVKGRVTPSDIVAAGLKFAKSYKAGSGGSKIVTPSKEVTKSPAPSAKSAKADSGSDKTVTLDSKGEVLTLDEDKETSRRTSAIVAEHGIAAQVTHPAADENREKGVYFKAWGKPEGRTGTAAQNRKVIIQGNPIWPVTPKAYFISRLVFGGPLEEIRCIPHAAEVTFLNGADAQKYHDATGNGILFRADDTGKHYAEVRLAEDVTPTSGLVQQHVDKGATRCVSAIGFPEKLAEDELLKLGGGKLTAQGTPARKIESIEAGINERGYPAATFNFCNIRDAVAFRGELMRDEEWEGVNTQYTTDPCEIATGARVELSASMLSALR